MIFRASIVAFAFLIPAVSWGFLQWADQEPETVTIPQAVPAAPKVKEPQELTLLFVGDIMLDRGVEYELKKNGADWTWPFHHIADFLAKADLVFGNLESQISDKGVNVGSIYSFRADPQSMQALTYAGFDVLSVANNHSFDYTKQAFEDSKARLQQAGIMPLADELVIKELEHATIGFLAYSNFPGPALVDWNNLNQVIRNIRQSAEKVDILVVSLHAGEEYQPQPNQFQKAFARAAIDAGADIIAGHHPHVLQPLEQYKEGWIAYSLGNFVFDQKFSEETMRGAILKVVIADKKIKEASLLPTKLNDSYQIELVQ
ncbi:MAG TPA: CapA family protein [Candidatus Paceibacterota bacterium]|nr:CapA family protein [Candidatus Paceibacterota bacterium]